MKTLILPIGLPRSGKTTWARAQDFPIVSPDSIRLAIHGQRFIKDAEDIVWATAKIMVKSLFLAGHDTVIVDATNIKERDRTQWRDVRWVRQFTICDATKEICIERAKALNDEYILPIIESMAAKYEPLNIETELSQHEKDFYAKRS